MTAGDTQLVLNWDDAGEADFLKYVVEYKLASEPTTWTAHSEPTSSNATITGLTNYVAYDVRVRTVDASLNASSNTTGSGTPTWDLSNLPNLITRFHADTSTRSPGTSVSTLTDILAATAGDQTVTQATDANKPAYVAAAGGHPSYLDFDGSNDVLSAAGADTNLNPLWSGAGGTIVAIIRPVGSSTTIGAIFTAGGASAAQRGFRLRYQPSTTRLFTNASNGTNQAYNDSNVAALASTDASHSIVVRYTHAAAGRDDYEIWVDGVKVAGGDSANAPDPGAPAAASQVGTTLAFRLYEMAVMSADISTGDIAKVAAYKTSILP